MNSALLKEVIAVGHFALKCVVFRATPGDTSGSKWRNIGAGVIKIEIIV